MEPMIMKTLTLSLNDTLAARLEKQAQQQDISVEEVITNVLETLTESSLQESRVEEGIEYVIAKNRELLQRLA
ncbi:MAG: hypothetical protein EAZ92_06410 [Candidatus Kapaibacterium sp.]|nr:MAG: hypothetical protein EAZ92_06410 [Candidatus Kapabacteria bacterium]